MAEKYVMINDIIEEHNSRMLNLKKYYPFFVLSETTFTQYKEGKYADLDMGYITMALLRFLIHENNFNERDITYEEYENFMSELLTRDFDVEIEPEDMAPLVSYIFDKIKNDGKAFEFTFYDPGKKQKKKGRVKLLDSKISDGRVLYYITADGIEFYLDTKEVKDESKISVEQLLLEKMITGENFRGGIEVVRRINSEVSRLLTRKDEIVDLLGRDALKGAKEYEEYMKTVGKWFSDEQKMFAKNKALVDKAIAKATFDNMNKQNASILEEISQLELELKRTILRHGNLISSTMELQNISDNIIGNAKLKKLRPVFDFGQQLQTLIGRDKPEDMLYVLAPLFSPRINKTFSIRSIDNLLTLKGEGEGSTVKAEKGAVDVDFVYEDEILENQIGRNFGRLFFELMDQLKKWKQLSLKEYNGIVEIKFGKDIYNNIDYYAFLTHLAQKKEYDIAEMLQKQDTMLEGMVVEAINQGDDLREDFSFEKYKNLRFSLEFDPEEEIQIGDDMYVTNMYFAVNEEKKQRERNRS